MNVTEQHQSVSPVVTVLLSLRKEISNMVKLLCIGCVLQLLIAPELAESKNTDFKLAPDSKTNNLTPHYPRFLSSNFKTLFRSQSKKNSIFLDGVSTTPLPMFFDA